VFMSAINIPDISRVLQHHKLIPVPVDVDVRTLQVDAKSLDACLSVARQRNLRVAFVMVAHLWGRVSDVSSTVSICRAHRDTPLVEDLAECFQGGKYIGSPYSEFCFFSFGAIKTNTAFGGSIVRLKNRDTHERMAQLQREYRPQPKKVFWRKIYSCFAAALLLNSSKANRAVSLTGRCVGWDPKPHVVSLLRGFSGDIIYRLRHAPSRALLAFLSWRLDNFSPANAAANADRAELMLQMMPTAMRERVPGIDVPVKDRSHWLFPIVPQDTERTLRLLVRARVCVCV
jgi:perosamine synthetase